jgi:glycosyltransferase involved in cell wall biosynthesis
MEEKKIKILTLGDHPLSPSGVGTQSRYVFEALLKSGKFSIFSLGGAMKHNDYSLTAVEPYGQDWRILPVDGYGTPDMIRSILRNEKPDILWMMTDPRFYEWLWSMENEIRPLCPIVYYHVWDNYPYPMFNKKFYESNDHIVSISQLTDDIVRNVSPSVPCTYIPHAVRGDIFISNTTEERRQLREQNLPEEDRDKFIAFWNNRNARRKQSGTLIWWWKEWLDKRGLHDKAQLIMHTNPKDGHGQDLNHIIEHLGMTNRQVLFSTNKVDLPVMSTFYNLADVTINISDAEGFGLATLESLSCGTPIIATMTGGLQEQVIGDGGPFGIPLFPTSKAIIGSQNVPYIYEDRISKDHFLSALDNMYDMGQDERRRLGSLGRQHILNNYNFQNFEQRWVDLMLDIYETEGSWESRANYNGIVFKEIA